MNFQYFVNRIKDRILQELLHTIKTEEQFDDKIWITLHASIDDETKHLDLKTIDELLVDYGLNKALYLAMSNNALDASPEYGENIYSPSVLRNAILESMNITWGDYKEYKDEAEEGNTEDEDEEKEETCDDCDEPFKIVGSLTIKMMFDDKFLCKDCCVKRCEDIHETSVPDELLNLEGRLECIELAKKLEEKMVEYQKKLE